ncbi:hypothetical protein ACIBCN_35280 [Nocardia sp. NPDC051052]
MSNWRIPGGSLVTGIRGTTILPGATSATRVGAAMPTRVCGLSGR